MPAGFAETLTVASTAIALLVGPWMYFEFFFATLLRRLLHGEVSLIDNAHHLVPRLVWFALFLYLTCLAFVSFLRCVITDAGRVPFEFSFEASLMCEGMPLVTRPRPRLSAAAAASENVCEACQVFKPARTHHCSKCKRCVLKYDHHCPWVGRCIGYYNYKYFLQLLTSIWLLTWVVNLTLLFPAAQGMGSLLGTNVLPVPGCEGPEPAGLKDAHATSHRYVATPVPTPAIDPDADQSLQMNANQSKALPPHDPISVRIAPVDDGANICGLWMIPLFFGTMLVQGLIGYLFNRHVHLLRHNMTTLEYVQYGRIVGSRYSLGSWRANVRAVFGERAKLWDYLWPTHPALSEDDGLLFSADGEPPS